MTKWNSGDEETEQTICDVAACTSFVVDLEKLTRKGSPPWEIIGKYFYVIVVLEIPIAVTLQCST